MTRDEVLAAGGTEVDGGELLDAPSMLLAQLLFSADVHFEPGMAPEVWRREIARELVRRGDTACGCDACQMIEAIANGPAIAAD